ncbi:unnamed protein product [Hymenolepis diminuta]|uniref:Uncharacterized protein n=1 Tax=Hymenolepis diminuta TaxID=6216 RepID=A0A564YS37_HYMDI|nr:unnamed protein product [Hymenolepis diminuta]
MKRTVRTINHAMLPKDKINEPVKSYKGGVFTVGVLMFAHDFQICHSWIVGIFQEKLSVISRYKMLPGTGIETK